MRNLEEKVASQGNQPESGTRSAEQAACPKATEPPKSQSEAEEGEAARKPRRSQLKFNLQGMLWSN